MYLGIRRIIKLSHNHRTFYLSVQLLRFCNRALHPFLSVRQYKLRSVCLQQRPPLHAHAVRKRQNRPVPLCRRHARQTNAGIAACGLNNGGAFLQDALFFSVFYHIERHSVLHTACRIQIFQLCENHCVRYAHLLHIMPHSHQGRISYQHSCIFHDFCHILHHTFLSGLCFLSYCPVRLPSSQAVCKIN